MAGNFWVQNYGVKLQNFFEGKFFMWQGTLPHLGFCLVIDAEEGLAIFTLGILLVNKFVQGVEIDRSGTIHVIPPITDEVLLIENCSIGA